MSKNKDEYDYNVFDGEPDLAAFYMGWLGQVIADHVSRYIALYRRPDADAATNEIYRLVAVAESALGPELHQTSRDVAGAMESLANLLLSDDWWSSDQILAERRQRQAYEDVEEGLARPRFLMTEQPVYVEGSKLLIELDTVVRGLTVADGRLCLARAGSMLRQVDRLNDPFGCRLIPGEVSGQEVINTLVDLDLLDSSKPWTIVVEHHLVDPTRPEPPQLPSHLNAQSQQLPLDPTCVFRHRGVPVPPAVPGEAIIEAGRARLSASLPVVAEEPPEWPPDDGWHFEAERYAFRRLVGHLSGLRLGVLRRLASQPGSPVSEDQLRELWDKRGGAQPEQLKQTVSRLREDVRQVFQLLPDKDPIPIQGKGVERSWRLDVKLLNQAADHFGNTASSAPTSSGDRT